MQGWSKRKFWKLLQSGSTCGSLQRHVGRKKGKACRVCRAAWHFVTVTVEQATVTVKLLLSGCAHCRWQIRHLNEPRAWIYFTNLSPVKCFSLNTWCSVQENETRAIRLCKWRRWNSNSPPRQFHLDWTKTEDTPIDEFNALNILHISTVFQRITFLASAMINWIEASLSNIDFYIHAYILFYQDYKNPIRKNSYVKGAESLGGGIIENRNNETLSRVTPWGAMGTATVGKPGITLEVSRFALVYAYSLFLEPRHSPLVISPTRYRFWGKIVPKSGGAETFVTETRNGAPWYIPFATVKN